MCRPILILTAAVLAGACGSTPPAPTPAVPVSSGVALGTGRRNLTIIGDSLTCGDVRNPQSGTAITVDVMVTSEGMASMLRAGETRGGSFEIRIERAAGTGMFGAIPLTGSARGYAIDSLDDGGRTPTGTRLTFDPSGGEAVPLTGLSPFTSYATGTFQGTVEFSRNGVVSSCPPGSTSWSLSTSSGQ
jgi:hypothetical protein